MWMYLAQFLAICGTWTSYNIIWHEVAAYVQYLYEVTFNVGRPQPQLQKGVAIVKLEQVYHDQTHDQDFQIGHSQVCKENTRHSNKSCKLLHGYLD